MKLALMCLSAMALSDAASASTVMDATAVALTRCLSTAANAPTAGQTDCEAAAAKAYDRRMNVAFASLMRKLPHPAGQRLRLSQRAWLAFRDSETATREALYETRQGTMYVPMQASDTTNAIRDRALQLEGYVAVLAIQT